MPSRALALLLAALACAALAADTTAPDPLRAPHRASDGRFFNPWGASDNTFLDFLRWRFSRNAYDKSAVPVIHQVANDGRSLGGTQASAELTWIGHASVAIHDGDDVVLTDPHFGERALLPRRVVPPGVPIGSIPPDAFAVISHSHYDHLDAWTVENLPASVGWYVPLGLGEFFRKRGRTDVTELDWWQSATRGRWTITCLPSQHWSLRLGDGRNETLWCAWLLDSGEHRYFFAGDTGYFDGFAAFGRELPPIDVAILPIGAYAPRWFMKYQHMNPAEAWQAYRDLGARYLLPIHWGTFDLTDEPLDRPPIELTQAVEAASGDPARVRVLAIGERWHLPEDSGP
jgi:N-acyl-phosphatidylethanolamine-hydrolysing phospholipase D